jgi:hypothetical protein
MFVPQCGTKCTFGCVSWPDVMVGLTPLYRYCLSDYTPIIDFETSLWCVFGIDIMVYMHTRIDEMNGRSQPCQKLANLR